MNTARPTAIKNPALALIAWATAAGVYVAAHAVDTEFSMFWVFGLAFGIRPSARAFLLRVGIPGHLPAGTRP